jgi:hypothetical protein
MEQSVAHAEEVRKLRERISDLVEATKRQDSLARRAALSANAYSKEKMAHDETKRDVAALERALVILVDMFAKQCAKRPEPATPIMREGS